MTLSRPTRLLAVCAVVASLVLAAPAAQAQDRPDGWQAWLREAAATIEDLYRKLIEAERLAGLAEECAGEACQVAKRAGDTTYQPALADLTGQAEDAAKGASGHADEVVDIAAGVVAQSEPGSIAEVLGIPDKLRQQVTRAGDAVRTAEDAAADVRDRYEDQVVLDRIALAASDGAAAAEKAQNLLDLAEQVVSPADREWLLGQAEYALLDLRDSIDRLNEVDDELSREELPRETDQLKRRAAEVRGDLEKREGPLLQRHRQLEGGEAPASDQAGQTRRTSARAWQARRSA